MAHIINIRLVLFIQAWTLRERLETFTKYLLVLPINYLKYCEFKLVQALEYELQKSYSPFILIFC